VSELPEEKDGAEYKSAGQVNGSGAGVRTAWQRPLYGSRAFQAAASSARSYGRNKQLRGSMGTYAYGDTDQSASGHELPLQERQRETVSAGAQRYDTAWHVSIETLTFFFRKLQHQHVCLHEFYACVKN
jgi:hypothetical protein